MVALLHRYRQLDLRIDRFELQPWELARSWDEPVQHEIDFARGK